MWGNSHRHHLRTGIDPPLVLLCLRPSHVFSDPISRTLAAQLLRASVRDRGVVTAQEFGRHTATVLAA